MDTRRISVIKKYIYMYLYIYTYIYGTYDWYTADITAHISDQIYIYKYKYTYIYGTYNWYTAHITADISAIVLVVLVVTRTAHCNCRIQMSHGTYEIDVLVVARTGHFQHLIISMQRWAMAHCEWDISAISETLWERQVNYAWNKAHLSETCHDIFTCWHIDIFTYYVPGFQVWVIHCEWDKPTWVKHCSWDVSTMSDTLRVRHVTTFSYCEWDTSTMSDTLRVRHINSASRHFHIVRETYQVWVLHCEWDKPTWVLHCEWAISTLRNTKHI